jgi:hypothetical protein
VTTPAHHERVDRVLKEAVGRDLSSWERHTFLPSLKSFWYLSDKQEKLLQEIEIRVFGDDD